MNDYLKTRVSAVQSKITGDMVAIAKTSILDFRKTCILRDKYTSIKIDKPTPSEQSK